jgi:hypothetical protein
MMMSGYAVFIHVNGRLAGSPLFRTAQKLITHMMANGAITIPSRQVVAIAKARAWPCVVAIFQLLKTIV